MKIGTVLACVFVAAVLSVGCNATSRYKVLSFLFDGVPPPPSTEAAERGTGGAPADAVPPRKIGYRGHGPYAAKMCDACHVAAATNALVAPAEELCFRCHEFSTDKKYIHGPLASGGCRACHDPHSSQYRYLLVSESDTFCFHCHQPDVVAKSEVHGDIEGECTVCHDAHMSDQQYLLR
jgi:predicted CXXCH cytochrome family protein